MAKRSQQVKWKTLLTNQQAENELHLENDWGWRQGVRHQNVSTACLGEQVVWEVLIFSSVCFHKEHSSHQENSSYFFKSGGGGKPLIINSQWPLRTTAFNVI